jgi:glycine cleavage system H lipoate-binding protein
MRLREGLRPEVRGDEMELYATKGVEYLLALAYLLLLVPFWQLLDGRGQKLAADAGARASTAVARWFELPSGLGFHPGHAWARADAGDVVTVGLDGFAGRMIGTPTSIGLPDPGTRLDAGRAGFRVALDGYDFRVLSPVSGEVLEVNEEAARDPGLVPEDPYGDGWLLRVRVPATRDAMSDLLKGPHATAWIGQEEQRLASMLDQRLGLVLQDGGEPVHGFARALRPDGWHELVSELLLTPPERRVSGQAREAPGWPTRPCVKNRDEAVEIFGAERDRHDT